jgi:predicted transcriptional regulator
MPPLSTPFPISSITRINSTVKDLFIYLYDLSPLDLDLLIVMIKNKKSMTLEQLARQVDRDKSTTFRSLKKLVGLGICMKETKSIKEGGYYHLYSAVDIETFKMETERRVKDIEQSFHRILKKFEEDLEKMIGEYYSSSNNK